VNSRLGALPKREVEIAKRLKEIRLSSGLSQQAFADKLGIKRERLASYESQRVPVKFDTGFLACLETGFSLRWLATGQGLSKPTENVSVKVSLEVPRTFAFSEGYDQFLEPEIGVRSLDRAEKNDSGAEVAKRSKEVLTSMVEYWKKVIPDSDWSDFVKLLWSVADEFQRNKIQTLMRHRKAHGKPSSDLFSDS
jgi:transcriptional regulator with XRE-family HTH domain